MKKKSMLFMFMLFFSLVSYSQNNYSKDFTQAVSYHLEANQGNLKSCEKAEKMYLKVIANNNSEKGMAYRNLGELFLHTPAIMRDYDKAMKYYLLAEEILTDPLLQSYATYNIGFMYYKGSGVAQDFHKAYAYFSKAALYNDALAIAVGQFIHIGLLEELDMPKAMDYYLKAAKAGNSAAWSNIFAVAYSIEQLVNDSVEHTGLNLYNKYLFEYTTGNDYKSAVSHIFESAELGFAPAQWEIGTYYLNGDANLGIQSNYEVAKLWFEKAIAQNYIPAYFSMGNLYELSNDLKKAFPYFQKSAIGGLPHGQVAVAYYYQFGAGDMAIDYVVAQSWLDKGVEQGFALAKERREILQNQIAQQNSQSVAQATAEVRPQLTKADKWLMALNVISNVANVASNATNTYYSHKNRTQPVSYTSTQSSSGGAARGSNANTCSDSNKLMNKNTEQRVYDDYASKLMDMHVWPERYNESKRIEYQNTMKRIREKWLGQGCSFYQSQWESWSGR